MLWPAYMRHFPIFKHKIGISLAADWLPQDLEKFNFELWWRLFLQRPELCKCSKLQWRIYMHENLSIEQRRALPLTVHWTYFLQHGRTFRQSTKNWRFVRAQTEMRNLRLTIVAQCPSHETFFEETCSTKVFAQEKYSGFWGLFRGSFRFSAIVWKADTSCLRKSIASFAFAAKTFLAGPEQFCGSTSGRERKVGTHILTYWQESSRGSLLETKFKTFCEMPFCLLKISHCVSLWKVHECFRKSTGKCPSSRNFPLELRSGPVVFLDMNQHYTSHK